MAECTGDIVFSFFFECVGVPSSPSSVARFLDATEPRGTGVSAALTGSTLPASSCMHRRYRTISRQFEPSEHVPYFGLPTLEARFATPTLVCITKHLHAIQSHRNIGMNVRIGPRKRSAVDMCTIRTAIDALWSIDVVSEVFRLRLWLRRRYCNIVMELGRYAMCSRRHMHTIRRCLLHQILVLAFDAPLSASVASNALGSEH